MAKQTPKPLNLKNDIVFKTFFSRKGNEEFLIDFLSALLKIEIKRISIREEVNLEQLSIEEKGGRLDLQAELNDGIIVSIELQICNHHDMENRTTFYSAKVLSKETERGSDYREIKQVYMINILDFELLGFEEYVSESVIVLDKHRDYEVLKGLKWYFIELPKFREKHPDMNEKLNQWIAFIDDYDKGMVKMAEKKNKTLEKARLQMNYLTGDAEVKRLAELREKWEMDYRSGMNYAKEEGLKEGIEKGIEKGIEQGIKKGKKQEQKEMVRKMLAQNLSIDMIIEITGLTKEEIQEIKESKESFS
jgi:predicted transposase/invertase (TIGR01784 family)